MNKINLLSNPKNERFSIRKMSIGVCSVVLGLVLINSINSNHIVLAEGNENNVEIKNEKNTSEFSNLVANGDFSQINSKRGKWTGNSADLWDSPWIPAPNNDAKVEIENGKLLFSSSSKFRAAVAQTINIDSSKKYELDYDVETADVEGSGVRIRTRSLDSDGKEILPKEQFYTPYTNKNNKKHITQKFQFSPETKKIKLEIFFENSTGTAYVDNVSFKEYVKSIDDVKEAPKPEKGKIDISTNKYYLTNLLDATYTVDNTKVATIRNHMILPRESGSTIVTISKDNKKIGNFTLNVSDHKENVYDKIRNSWERVSLGNENYKDNNPYMKSLLNKTENEVDSNLSKWDETQASDSIFKDINDFNKSANITTIYRRLEQFSQVLTNESSKYYENYDLAVKLKEGMKYLYDNVYNENKDIVGNWWDYQIGTPRAIVNILSYGNAYFSNEEIKKYLLPVDKFVMDPTHLLSADHAPAIGGNATDLSKVTILAGALKEDSVRIQKGVNALLPTLDYVEKGNGFYKDGSYIDHVDKDLHGVAYTGAYGNVLMDGFSQIMPMISDTSFALSSEKTDIVYSWIDNAYFPIIVNGELMDMTRGRSISRATSESHPAAIEALRGIVRIADASDRATKQRLLSLVKQKIVNDHFYVPYNNLKSYTDILLFSKLLSDNNISPAKSKSYIQIYYNMDKFVYNNADDKFAFAISMFSNRTKNYEDMNNKNRHGWYTSDGMFYLYNNNLAHYSNGYWPTIDPYMLPGTTELNSEREDGTGQNVLPSSFVGATKLNEKTASIAMDFTNYNKELTARKAWFVFGNKIVFLTTNIQNNSSKSSITTIENRKISGNNTKVYINGKNIDLSKPFDGKIQSLFIDSSNENQRIGYVFLNPISVQVKQEQRTHSWKEINYGQSDEPITNTFIKASHVTTHNGENLAYVLAPNQDPNALKMIQDEIKVMEQSENVQAVYDKENKVYGIIKYTNDDFKISKDLTLKQAGLYVVKKIDNGYEISFSHPREKFNYSELKEMNQADHFSILKEPSEVDHSTIIKVSVFKEDDTKPQKGNTINNNLDIKIGTVVNNNQSLNANSKSEPNKAIVKYLYHNAYLYAQTGKRMNKLVLKRFTTINTYGKIVINGKKYYRVDKGYYIAANNIDPVKRSLKRNSFVYNKFGNLVKRTTIATKKGRRINTYGSVVKINGKRFYTVGKNQFIKAKNFMH